MICNPPTTIKGKALLLFPNKKDNDNISLDHLYDSLFILFCLLWMVSQLF